MSTLVIPNMSPTALASLHDRASRANRTVEEEALAIIETALRPDDGEAGSCNYPRPLDGPTVAVRIGGERLPAPLAVEEATPE